ncbi:MAG: J domain-containing protein [Clostridia bacterium]|nr:J domain-containing protein [Clostridia bacterium]
MDPYQVLGISPDATDEQVKAAYRELAKKYHPDHYGDNPLSDLAQEKMQQINEAYDTIIKQRRAGRSGGARSQYGDIRNLIRAGRIEDAEVLLDGIPEAARDAEWHFLKGSLLYKKGWLDAAAEHFSAACRMDPANQEYQAAFRQISARRQGGGYAAQPRGCSGCDMCTGLICADCCCESMGCDLIRCC